jgi:hypothetical protein
VLSIWKSQDAKPGVETVSPRRARRKVTSVHVHGVGVISLSLVLKRSGLVGLVSEKYNFLSLASVENLWCYGGGSMEGWSIWSLGSLMYLCLDEVEDRQALCGAEGLCSAERNVATSSEGPPL